jgi:hypothetical protein
MDTRFDYTLSDIHARIAEMDNDYAAPRRGFFIVTLEYTLLFAMHNDVVRCLPLIAESKNFAGMPLSRGYWTTSAYSIVSNGGRQSPYFKVDRNGTNRVHHHGLRVVVLPRVVEELDVQRLVKQYRACNILSTFRVMVLHPLPTA